VGDDVDAELFAPTVIITASAPAVRTAPSVPTALAELRVAGAARAEWSSARVPAVVAPAAAGYARTST
jgi:hypothetical protein